MSNMIKGYEVTVRGQYHAADGKNKFLRTYGPETFFIPETVDLVIRREPIEKVVNGQKVKQYREVKERVDGLKAALHIIMRKMLPTRLADKYKDFNNGIRRCRIVSSKRAELPAEQVEAINPTTVDEMSMAQLERFCVEKGLPVQPKTFGSLKDARDAVKDEWEAARSAPQSASAAPAETLPTDEDGATETEDGTIKTDTDEVQQDQPSLFD